MIRKSRTILLRFVPRHRRIALFGILISSAFLPLIGLTARSVGVTETVLRALIIGGGPEPKYNQVGIESNVRYVSRLLASGIQQTILFADGNPKQPTVQYEERSSSVPKGHTPGERAFDLLFDEDEGTIMYRPPKIPHIDGPSQRIAIADVFEHMKTELVKTPRPLLLYFTGHGSPSDGPDEDNTSYDLWGNGRPLTVRNLAREMEKLPKNVPVTLVMVQCFSGGFGNLIFENGDPEGQLVDRDFAGYFAATNDRMSAGCTPSTDEEDYKDFTSYFFTALSGRDRLGRKVVVKVDYNKDGRIGMDEAYAYSLVADESIDVPTCTSDIFLRRFIKTNEEEVMDSPYADLLAWGTPAQKTALEGLSAKLRLSGENRLRVAYNERKLALSRTGSSQVRSSWKRFYQLQDRYREAFVQLWPDLQKPKSNGYAAARKKAIKNLEQQTKEGKLGDLFKADESLSAMEDGPEYSMRQTRINRFARLGKSIVLAHRLMTDGDPTLQNQWKRIRAAETRSLPLTDTLASSRH